MECVQLNCASNQSCNFTCSEALMLGVVTARERDFQLRNHDNEWWMKRRRLPSSLRKRVQRYELQKWEAVGDDEMDFVKDLPVGLRLDIKRYLCLDLIKKIIKEGDPVRQMVFIVSGHVKSCQGLGKAVFATNFLEQGDFLGDELLTWSLRRPFIERLPSSSSTFVCLDLVEAYGIDADDLRYITNHYRPEFMDRRLKQKARYHSSNWRTWAAITIQCAWRRYRKKTKGLVAPSVKEDSRRESQLRRYVAILLSERPRDHLH
ncbi:hypothetical protein RJ641_006731 [Dillenia turbinata]|uniref:Cyclic nucleotide-binding domain-containing protein n=1 Tax=Dillenia turbinata TaxID=194707 RepID=A0AAN8ZAD9_9MAGN